MNEETNLHEGLEMAIECIRDLSPCYEGDEWDDSEEAAAISGIRAAQHYVADLAQRVAELDVERNNTAAHVASIARQLGDEALQVDDIAVLVLRLVAERDELRARLAEIEAQEPVAWLAPAEVSDDWPWPHVFMAPDTHPHIRELMEGFPVYAATVPAQAVPDGWRLVPVDPTPEMVDATISKYDKLLMDSEVMDEEIRTVWMQMINAAPEHTA